MTYQDWLDLYLDPGPRKPKALDPKAKGATRQNAIGLAPLAAEARRSTYRPILTGGERSPFAAGDDVADGLDYGRNSANHRTGAVLPADAPSDAARWAKRPEVPPQATVGPYRGTDEDYRRGGKLFEDAMRRRADFMRQSPQMRVAEHLAGAVTNAAFLGRTEQLQGLLDPTRTAADYDAQRAALPKATGAEQAADAAGGLAGMLLPWGVAERGVDAVGGRALGGIFKMANRIPLAHDVELAARVGVGGRLAQGAAAMGSMRAGSRGGLQDPNLLRGLTTDAMMAGGFVGGAGLLGRLARKPPAPVPEGWAPATPRPAGARSETPVTNTQGRTPATATLPTPESSATVGAGATPSAGPLEPFVRPLRNNRGAVGDDAPAVGPERQPMQRSDVPRAFREDAAGRKAYASETPPARRQGYEAATKYGLSRDVNPHEEGTPEWKQFDQGWRSAQPRTRETRVEATPGEQGPVDRIVSRLRDETGAVPMRATEAAQHGDIVPERITRATVRYRGKVYAASGTHADAFERLQKEFPDLPWGAVPAEDYGFATNVRPFITRAEAAAIAEQSQQLRPDLSEWKAEAGITRQELDTSDMRGHRAAAPSRGAVRLRDLSGAVGDSPRFVAQPATRGRWQIIDTGTGSVAEEVGGIGAERTARVLAKRYEVERGVTAPADAGPLAGTRVVDETGTPKVVYHGTSKGFEEFDPSQLDKDAQYGPGYYFTEHPDVAGGYTGKGADFASHFSADELRARMAEREQRIADPRTAPSALDGLRAQQQFDREALSVHETPGGPNVRPARLALRNPFDIDATYSPEDVRAIATTASADNRDAWESLAGYMERQRTSRFSGEQIYDAFRTMGYQSKADINDILKDAGFDSITHIGGGNTGTDPHRVWIAFDRPQIRSAFGPAERAAQTGATAPGTTGVRMMGGMTGAIGGGAYGATQGDSPEERAANALAFGAAGALGGAGLAEGYSRVAARALPEGVARAAERIGEGGVGAGPRGGVGDNAGARAGFQRVYHRTSPEAAEAIYRTGRFTSREATEPVYVSNRRLGQAEGYGEAVVPLDVPERLLELDDEFPGGELHYRIPASAIKRDYLVRPAPDGISPRVGNVGAVGDLPDPEQALFDALNRKGKPVAGRDLSALVSGDMAPADFARTYGIRRKLAENYVAHAGGLRDPEGYPSPLDSEEAAYARPDAAQRPDFEYQQPPEPAPIDGVPDDGFLPADAPPRKYGAGEGQTGHSILSPEGVTTVRRSAMLMNVAGRLRDIVSNVGMGTAETSAELIGTSVDMLLEMAPGLRGGRTMAFNVPQVARAAYEGATAGTADMLRSMRGRPRLHRSSMAAADAASASVEGAERVVMSNPVLDAAVRVTGRFAGSVDSQAAVFAYEKSIAEQARVIAINARKTERIPRAEARAMERQLRDSPTDEMKVLAASAVAHATFTNESVASRILTGMREATFPNADKGRGDLPWARAGLDFVAPFRRVPGAVAGKTLEYSPLGAVKMTRDAVRLYRLASAGADPKLIAEARRGFAKTTGRVGTGAVVIALGADLAGRGLMTGARLTPAEKRDGARPFSIKVAGRWWPLGMMPPVGPMLAVGAELHNGGAGEAAAALGENVADATLMRGMGDVRDAVSDPTKAARFASSAASSFVPPIVGQVAHTVDPVQRKPENALQAIEARIPGLSRAVPARVDALGHDQTETASTPGRIALSLLDGLHSVPARSDSSPLLKELDRISVAVPPLQRVSGEKASDYRARQRQVGGAIETVLNRAIFQRQNDAFYRPRGGETEAQLLDRQIAVFQRQDNHPFYRNLTGETEKQHRNRLARLIWLQSDYQNAEADAREAIATDPEKYASYTVEALTREIRKNLVESATSMVKRTYTAQRSRLAAPVP